MTEPHKQILLAVGIAALVWIVLFAIYRVAAMQPTKALFDSPKARPLRGPSVADTNEHVYRRCSTPPKMLT